MGAPTIVPGEGTSPVTEAVLARGTLEDPRFQVVERIARSAHFQRSSRLPALLRYLARCTLAGDRHRLTEQAIGRAVFGKSEHYTTAEDSSVRVYVRQLRLRLYEYYQTPGVDEPFLVSLPKGGYALSFSPATQQRTKEAVGHDERRTIPAKQARLPWIASFVLFAAALTCAFGWFWTAHSMQRTPPWPLNQIIGAKLQTTLVLADAGYSLRMLGDQEVPLDQYVNRSFVAPLIPQHLSKGEARLIDYLEVSRITSMADAEAAAAFSALSTPYSQNLVVRSAKNLSPNDLTRGNFIFVGARTSNPWVQLFQDQLNFVLLEDGPGGRRYIVNRKPLPGEQATYSVPASTGSSGEDYGTIALLPASNGSGDVLLIQGLRMEGTEAALDLLKDRSQRAKLQQKLVAATSRRTTPKYFEALVRAQSVAGAQVSVDLVAVRPHS